jgi:predicted transcriptional regulator
VAASRVERLLSPLAHEGRVSIMQALWRGSLSASELAGATGYRGGALYHHLRELDHAAYVASEGGSYRLTDWGRQLLLTAACLAEQLVVDDGERGLTFRGDWTPGG